MHLEFGDLLLVVNVPYTVFSVDAGTNNVSIVDYFDFVDDSVALHVDFQHLICLCAVQDKQAV